MSEFDPGEGWAEVTGAHSIPAPCITFSDGTTVRRWVRVPPVPPLPTEPYTVFRTTHATGGTATWLRHPNGTLLAVNSGEFWNEDPRDAVFEVLLAQPQGVLDAAAEAFEEKLKRVRRETAKTVLDRVHEAYAWSVTAGISLAQVAREFGVDS